MSAALYLIEPDGSTLRVRLLGDVDAPLVEQLLGELEQAMQTDSFAQVWVDLMQMTACPMDVRPLFARLSHLLIQHSERRVFIAGSPRFRGIVLWALHITQDSHGKIVASPAQAEEWMAADDTRLAAAERAMLKYSEGR